MYSPEAVSYPCTSCLLPAFDDAYVMCLRLSDVSIICRVTYFHFPIQSAFLLYIGRQQAAPALRPCDVLLVLMRNIGHRTLPKIWVGTFLVQIVQQGKDFELILTAKKWKLGIQ